MRYTGKSFDKTVSSKRKGITSENNTKMRVLQTIPVKENGRIVNKSEFADIDMVDVMKGYKLEDFYLENMIADGTISQLSSVQVERPAIVGIDGVVSQIPKMDDYLEKNIIDEE